MTDNLIQQINELKEKAVRYENLKERYEGYGLRIKKIVEELTALQNEIMPYLTIKERRTYSNHTEIIEELHTRMNQGTQVNSELIQRTYNLDVQQAWYILNKLKKLPHIQIRKDGNKLYVYYQKEV